MDASNRVRHQPAVPGAHRRPDCSPPRGREDGRRSTGGGADRHDPCGPFAELRDDPLRALQLAVIVDLLRRAAAEVAEGDAASPGSAESPK
jgi:hypothetical protein